MAKMGRPPANNDKAKAEILLRLSAGEPLADICRDEDMPAVRTVSHWKAQDADFMADFARARDDGHDAIATRLRHTARGLGESTGDVPRDKLIIETDLKLLAKWDKRYGDKLTVDSKSEVVHRYDLDNLADTELDQLEQLLAKSGRGEAGEGKAEPAAVH